MNKSVFGIFVFIELIFLWAILAVTGPTDRQHNTIVIAFSEVVFAANLFALIIYPLKRTAFLSKVVTSLVFATGVSMLLLAVTCQPNKEVRGVFTIDSALNSGIKPSP
jgi:hypothetical protein